MSAQPFEVGHRLWCEDDLESHSGHDIARIANGGKPGVGDTLGPGRWGNFPPTDGRLLSERVLASGAGAHAMATPRSRPESAASSIAITSLTRPGEPSFGTSRSRRRPANPSCDGPGRELHARVVRVLVARFPERAMREPEVVACDLSRFLLASYLAAIGLTGAAAGELSPFLSRETVWH